MQMRTESIKPGQSSDDDVNAILEKWRTHYWGDTTMFGVIAQHPDLLKASQPVIDAMWPGESEHNITGHLLELMRVKNAATAGCAHCLSVRTISTADTVSTKEDAMAAFQPPAGPHLSERESLAVCLAERLAIDPHLVDDEFFGRLRAAFTAEEIVELIFGFGVLDLGAKFNITLRLDNEHDSLAYEDVLSGAAH
jgi:alkylhydroperoxidase family enzyme